MYFWRIEKLKTQMAAQPLSERESLPYLIANLALCAATASIPQDPQNIWDGLGVGWSLLLTVLGTIYVYRQNGGAGGRHFLQRYFAIGWVVAFRWAAAVIAIAVVIFGGLAAVDADMGENTQWYEFVLSAVAETLFYWRLGHHVKDLAAKTADRPS